jgi:hypothetical protein
MPMGSSARRDEMSQDEELDQLVSDIEELREAMSAAPRKKTSRKPMPEARAEGMTEPGSVSDFHASADEPSMEETLGELKEDDSAPRGRSLLDNGDGEGETGAGEDEEARDGAMASYDADDEDVYEDAEGGQTMTGSKEREMAGGAADEGSLTMSIRGNMTLKLKYECDGCEVMVGVQGNALVVQLADGTEFKIPVRGRGSSRLKAVG